VDAAATTIGARSALCSATPFAAQPDYAVTELTVDASSDPLAQLSWDEARAFRQVLTVTSEHLDDFGHTNNVVYLSWLERVAWAHSIHLGLDFAEYERLGVGCVVRRHEIDYLAATHAGDELAIATWIGDFDGRLSMTRMYQIIRVADRRTVLRGRSHWVSVDLRSGRPRRMPPEFDAYRPTGG
jgi:acyl-CoA thioester hydrolase